MEQEGPFGTIQGEGEGGEGPSLLAKQGPRSFPICIRTKWPAMLSSLGRKEGTRPRPPLPVSSPEGFGAMGTGFSSEANATLAFL